jgi:UDP:flavonoid glycosyltransferase YjiC (YdhE family)
LLVRVLFAAGGGTSMFYPLVPLAWAFRAAGHEVLLVGKPQAAEWMMQTGLPVKTLGGPPKLSGEAKEVFLAENYTQPPWLVDWPTHPESLTPEQTRLLERLGRYTIAVADGIADDLVAFAKQWRPDVILHDEPALSASVAGTLLGVPCVRHSHGTQDAFRMEYRIPDNEPLPEYTAMFERFGAEPPVVRPRYVDTMPPSMYIGAEQPGIEMRYVPYNGSGQLPDGLAGPRSRPRVCVTWGVSLANLFGNTAGDPYRDAIAAIAADGMEVLVLVANLVPSSGVDLTGVRYLVNAPLNLVLPYCDAILHHGGDGTAMTAACLAVPQLIIPREPLDDQMTGRFVQTGVAIHLVHQKLEQDPGAGGQIRDTLDRLLTEPSYTAAATRLRDEIQRQPAPADVVAEIAALTAG